jgi:glycine/D-amino acid oxidase-like deaminating enzyme
VVRTDRLDGALSMLRAVGVSAGALGADELADRYPQLTFAAGTVALLERDAGVLLADRVLNACVGWLRWHAEVDLLPHREVVSVDGTGAAVHLAEGQTLHADAVVVAAGAWSRALLPPATAERLTLYRQSMLYCRTAHGEARWSALPAMPALGTPHGCWLVPPVAGTPLKLTTHSACRAVGAVTDRDTDPEWRQHLLEAFAPLIPDLRATWITAARDCYYLADAVAGGPLLVRLGDAVVAYAACGGISFKFAPLIARALARQVTGASPEPTGLAAVDTPYPGEPVTAPRALEGD